MNQDSLTLTLILSCANLAGVACAALILRSLSLVLTSLIIKFLEHVTVQRDFFHSALKETRASRMLISVYHNFVTVVCHVISFAVFLFVLTVGIRYQYHDRDANARETELTQDLRKCQGWLADLSR